jgi:hypothetical protein
MIVKFDIPFFISVAAIIVMFYCLVLVISHKKNVSGGMIGKKWNFLLTLVVLFTFGYMSTPFFGMIPEGLLRFIAGFIFFFGAIYVVITVKLIYNIITTFAKKTLGVDATKVVNKIEKSPDSREALKSTIEDCKKLFKLIIDEKKAEELGRKCRPLLQKCSDL